MISENLYNRVLEKMNRLNSLRPLDKLQVKKIKEEFLVEYVYNSTSIEGNTLTLNETRQVLEDGITVGGKSLREHLDVTNQKEALDWIEQYITKKRKVSIVDILMLHRISIKGISDFWAGRFKTSQNRIVGSKHKTTPPYKVQNEMENLVYFLNNNPKKYNQIEIAAFAHHEIARIHPFVDGNGRTARLLCNLMLMSSGYPPVLIRLKDRNKYFDCLEKAHFGNLEPFFDFIAKMVEESLWKYLSALTATTAMNEILPLSVLAEGTPYSQEYLSLLARKGKLSATKINDVWHSSREEIQRYIGSRKYRYR